MRIFNRSISIPNKSKSKVSLAECSNLSPSELKGLKSLQSRVNKQVLVVCETDKSGKLCILSKDQYLKSGMARCQKDLEISLNEVIQLQKYVNANVEWLNDIFSTGEFWGHEDRIRTSCLDQGAQAAPLRLLIKDHKAYDPSSSLARPSRPVVNGKSGYNCHLSEILSLILGPVAKEATGSEINSTGDLLAEINLLNQKLSSPPTPDPTEPNDDEFFCDFCSNCNNPPPTAQEIAHAKSVIERVSNKKVNSAMHVSNVIRSKLHASRAATKLYHRCCMGESVSENSVVSSEPEDRIPVKTNSECRKNDIAKLSRSQEGSKNEGGELRDFSFQNSCSSEFSEPDNQIEPQNPVSCNVNDNDNLIVSGFDVESLYPSLRDVDPACLARESILHSKIDFKGINFQKALAYLRIIAGEQVMRLAGLGRLIPK